MKYKKIGLIVAMDKEYALLRDYIVPRYNITNRHTTIAVGVIGNTKVALVKSGIGKVNAAITSQYLIEHFNPELIINTGVAGGLRDVSVGDVVTAENVSYYDTWCGPGTEIGTADGCPELLPCKVLGNVKNGIFASGDMFVCENGLIKTIKERVPNAIAVDMESGAIAQVCYKNGVEFSCVRIISDTPDEQSDNVCQYENFWSEAPQLLFGAVIDVVNSL